MDKYGVMLSLVQSLAELHYETFNKIKEYFDNGSRTWNFPKNYEAKFISSVIGDYLDNFSVPMINNPELELTNIYNGNAIEFIKQAIYAGQNQKNCIINAFIIYHKNSEILTKYKIKELDKNMVKKFCISKDICKEADPTFLPKEDYKRLHHYLIKCDLIGT